MPLPTIPTTNDVKNRIISDLETAFNQSTPALLKSFNRVLAGALAGVIVLLYQSILWVYAQIFPDRADYESLILLGKLVGVTPLPAVAAVLTADVAGDEGATVTEGIRFTGTNGVTYEVTTGGTVSGGVADCELTALTAGEAGNLANGEELSIVSSSPFLTGTAVVTGTTTSGDDAESVESFRARVTARYKKRFTGGSPADYELWGLDTPNFVWVSPYASNTSPGTVIVYGRVDNQTDGIPTSGQLTELETYLTTDPNSGRNNRAPITDTIDTQAITRVTFNVEIDIHDGSPEVKDAVEDAVEQYFLSREPYNEGVSTDRVDAVTQAGLSSAAQEIAVGTDATILAVTMKDAATGTIIENYILYGGEHSKVGTVTWTDIT